MRDPFSWSFPLGRLLGVAIRVHLWFPILAMVLVLRVAYAPPPEAPVPPPLPNLWIEACILVGLWFVAVLLHELGHCLAARLVDGDVREVLLWPLGGLGAVDLPQTPYAHLVTAAAGPAVSLCLCAASGLLLAAHSFLPPWNPWEDQLAPALYNWADGRYHFDPQYQDHRDRLKLLMDRQAGKPPEPAKTTAPPDQQATASIRAIEPEVAWLGWGDILASRFFWVNWLLFLFNLLPGFPLDGGRMLQALSWSRGEYRQATQSAIVAGFLVMIGVLILGLVTHEFFLLILAWVVYSASKAQWYVLETGREEPGLGYELAPGYGGLEQPESPPARPRRPNFFQRWLQRRAQRKRQREQECREAEERRLDELLEKVTRFGIQALTDEERRFLTRVSSRYRDKQGR